MSTQQPQDVIGHYAKLSFQADVHRAAGRPVPAQVVSEMQAIEARASAMFTPQQMAEAIQHVNIAKSQMHTQLQATMQRQQKQQVQTDLNSFSRQLTGGLLGRGEGLTPQQFRELNAKGQVTLRADRKSQSERDAAVREVTKQFDPKGQGFTESEWATRLDQLADAPNDTYFKDIARSYNVPPDELRRTAKAWEKERIAYGLSKRMEAKTPARDEVLKPTDDDHRRMAVVNAYLEHGGKPDSGTAYQERIEARAHRAELEDTGIRGALAKSYEALSRDVPVEQVDREVRQQQQQEGA